MIQIAQNLGIKVLERAVDKSELLVAEEVFLTGTAAQITPINQIENYILPEKKPIFEKLQKTFNQIITENYQGENDEYKGWTIQIN